MAELAAHSGLSENVIENIEGGRRDPQGRRRRNITVDELDAIVNVLDGFSVSFHRERSPEEQQARNQVYETERKAMMEDPDVLAAWRMHAAASEMLWIAESRWRKANPDLAIVEEPSRFLDR